MIMKKKEEEEEEEEEEEDNDDDDDDFEGYEEWEYNQLTTARRIRSSRPLPPCNTRSKQ